MRAPPAALPTALPTALPMPPALPAPAAHPVEVAAAAKDDTKPEEPPHQQAPKAPLPSNEKTSGAYVQLGAFHTRDAAEKLKAAVMLNYASILGSNLPLIEENNTLFKIVVRLPESENSTICEALKKKQQYCLVIKG